MENPASINIRPFAIGIILALCAILFGFGLGAVFGAAESTVKESLSNSAEQVIDTVYAGNTEKANDVVKKSWGYMKRAHLHGGGIGAVALSAIAILLLLGRAGLIEQSSSIALGAGALIYSLFWMVAAFKGPALGDLHAAKESLKFMAIPGAALCILGTLGTLFSVTRTLFSK